MTFQNLDPVIEGKTYSTLKLLITKEVTSVGYQKLMSIHALPRDTAFRPYSK